MSNGMDGMNEKLPEAISLRDWFAGMAMQRIRLTVKFDWTPRRLAESNPNWDVEAVSAYAYQQADAMLKEREK